MNIYDLISRAQKLRKETQLDSVSPDRVGGLHEDTLKYINEFQLLASSPSLHKIYASVSAMQSDKSPKSDLTGKPLKPGQLVVIVPANQTDATAGDVYRYDGPSGNTSAWTFVAKIGAVPADAELSATSTNPPQNKVVTEKLTELESETNAKSPYIIGFSKEVAKRVKELYLLLDNSESYRFSFLRYYGGALQARIERESDGVTVAYSNQNIPLTNSIQLLYSKPFGEGDIVGYIFVNIDESDTDNATAPINIRNASDISFSPGIELFLESPKTEARIAKLESETFGLSINRSDYITPDNLVISIADNVFIPKGKAFKFKISSSDNWERLALFGNGDWTNASFKIDKIVNGQEYIVSNNVDIHNINLYLINPSDTSITITTEILVDNYIIPSRLLNPIFKFADDLANRQIQELWLDNLSRNKRYYFKYMRWYTLNGNSYPQVRIYEFTKDDKSDEVYVAQVKGERYYNTAQSGIFIIEPVNSNIHGYILMNLQSYDNTQPEIDVEYVSQLGNNPSIRIYMGDAPQMSMPRNTYILNEEQNTIYHANYLSYYNPHRYTTKNDRELSLSNRFLRTNGISADRAITINLYDLESNKPINAVSTNLLRATKLNETAKIVNIIGDSFTYNGAWYQQIAELVKGLTFVGMRKSYSTTEPLRAEGRGGWTLDGYFSPHDDITPTHMQPFSPFVHVSGYRYYGVVEFWKAIVTNSSEYAYGTNGFDDYTSWFDSTGYMKSPSINDLMYDGTDQCYKVWNGTSWVVSDITDNDFQFDYAKYVETWNIAHPNIVLILLGKNDFYSGCDDVNWASWKSKMDNVINSIKLFDAEAIIGLCTPTTANALPYSTDNSNYQLGHRNMWEARKRMIDEYDTEAMNGNGVYLVDTGVVLDPDYGFDSKEELPFAYYDGELREVYGTNGVHPSTAGYKQIGTCAAAFIQRIRG